MGQNFRTQNMFVSQLELVGLALFMILGFSLQVSLQLHALRFLQHKLQAKNQLCSMWSTPKACKANLEMQIPFPNTDLFTTTLKIAAGSGPGPADSKL